MYNKVCLLSFIFLISSPCLSQTTEKRALSRYLSEYAANVNKDVPRVLDHETRLDNAFTTKNLLVYNNTLLNFVAAQIDPRQLEPNIQKAVIEPICKMAKYEPMIELGVEVVYRYYGKEGVFITELSQNLAECTN